MSLYVNNDDNEKDDNSENNNNNNVNEENKCSAKQCKMIILLSTMLHQTNNEQIRSSHSKHKSTIESDIKPGREFRSRQQIRFLLRITTVHIFKPNSI